MIFNLIYCLLISVVAYWALIWDNDPLWLEITVITPLLIPLPWLLFRRSHTVQVVAAFIAMLYFIHGVTETVANPQDRWLAIAETGLTLMLFISLIVENVLRRRRLNQASLE